MTHEKYNYVVKKEIRQNVADKHRPLPRMTIGSGGIGRFGMPKSVV
jgi:hypothetical protein